MTETISKGGVVQPNIPRHLTAWIPRISIMEFESVFFNSFVCLLVHLFDMGSLASILWLRSWWPKQSVREVWYNSVYPGTLQQEFQLWIKMCIFQSNLQKTNNYSPLLLQVSLKEILPICLSIWDCHFCAESGSKWKNLDEVFPELKLIHQIKSKKNDCLQIDTKISKPHQN